MEQYLKKEKDILEQNNSDFFDHTKVVTNWYSVKDGLITAHNKLVNAIGIEPDYIILSRYETDAPKRRITIYFNHKVEVVPYIPFGKWKLYDNTEQFGRHKYYTLKDPVGIIKTIPLTEYIPYIPTHLKPYLQNASFDDYDKSSNKDNLSVEVDDNTPIEITLNPDLKYLISIKRKNNL